LVGIALFGFAYDDLNNLPILPKVFVATQCLKEILLRYAGRETDNVNQVLLHNSETRKMLSIQRLDFTFLSFLVALFGLLLSILLNVRLELGNPKRC
jgi:hypothetical protein